MSRSATRPGARNSTVSSRVSRSVAEAHRHHGTTPFFGCPLCIRRTEFESIALRWSSPRLG